jgi:hypothetical protein
MQFTLNMNGGLTMRPGRRLAAAALTILLLSATPALANDPPGAAPAAQTAHPPPAPAASPRALELTRRYFRAMRMEATMWATMKAVMPGMVNQMARNNPRLTKAQQDALVEVAAQSSQDMVVKMMDRMTPIFAQSFSEKELQDLVDFYESPTGQALVAKTPAFAAKMNPTMNALLPEMLADMQTKLCAKVGCTTRAAGDKSS